VYRLFASLDFSDAEVFSINAAAASSLKPTLEKLILAAKNKKEIRSFIRPKENGPLPFCRFFRA